MDTRVGYSALLSVGDMSLLGCQYHTPDILSVIPSRGKQLGPTSVCMCVGAAGVPRILSTIGRKC